MIETHSTPTEICRKWYLIGLCLLLAAALQAQLCTSPGQTPQTAMLVCGTDAYTMSAPGFCGQTTVPGPCPTGFTYQNKNPHFFRMNCFSSGTLGFTIAPVQATAYYDWQLFDITSTNPADVFTNPALFVGCNWSSEPGETGALSDGIDLAVCGGPGGLLFSKMPDIVAGKSLYADGKQPGQFAGRL